MHDLEIVYLPPGELTPYENNARKHAPHDIDAIIASIEKFGFSDPIGIWSDKNIIVEGHGRQIAAIQMGMSEVPCIRLDHMTDEQRRAYALAHNKTAELSEWDFSKLEEELAHLEIESIDMSAFDFKSANNDWFDRNDRNDREDEEGNDEYNEFLDKFETKKTTDDCYTPENIYEAVSDWVAKEYGLSKMQFMRPFYPGGDYQKENYKKDTVVVDNPPFSILAEIVDFYVEHGIRFFLFAPGLTALNYVGRKNVCAICTYAGVTYENGANVSTSFLTNLGDGSIAAMARPDLYAALEEQNDINEKAMHKQLPKYEYPDEVVTAAKLGWLAKYGQRVDIRKDESVMIRQLDAMKEMDKGIYGNALLISERAAAEKAAATKWKLSDREREIVRSLGK